MNHDLARTHARRPWVRLAGLCAVVPMTAGLIACQPPVPDYASVFDGRAGRWVDLTHAFEENTVYWPTDTLGFQLRVLAEGENEAGFYYASNAFASAEHGGTHLDAPLHFAAGGFSAAEIPLGGLMGPAAVVDVSENAHPDYLVSVEDLTEWEEANGELPDGGILLLRTGWGERWPSRGPYLGTERRGPEAVAELHFPGLSPRAAQWLVDETGIVAVGIDTPSIDYGQSADFMAHRILYAENISGFENVAGLENVPVVGSFVVALPMKIAHGSGGPLRIVAFVPNESNQP